METEKNGSLKGSKNTFDMFLFNADRENGNVNIFLSFRWLTDEHSLTKDSLTIIAKIILEHFWSDIEADMVQL